MSVRNEINGMNMLTCKACATFNIIYIPNMYFWKYHKYM